MYGLPTMLDKRWVKLLKCTHTLNGNYGPSLHCAP